MATRRSSLSSKIGSAPEITKRVPIGLDPNLSNGRAAFDEQEGNARAWLTIGRLIDREIQRSPPFRQGRL
jgi:hypothetical protein